MISSSGPIGGVSARRFGALAAVLAALLVLAAPAAAKVRYASPAGGPPGACNPNPCTLTIAIAGAADGDQVVLLPGTYSAPIELTIEKAVDVGGTPGAAPLINLKGVQFNVENAGATLHDVRLVMAEEAMSRPLNVTDGTIERVIAGGGEFGAEGCLMEGGLMRDSLCLQGLSVNGNGLGVTRAKLVNVTADPLTVGTSKIGAGVDLDVLNSILYGRTEPGHLPGSVIVDVFTGGSVNVDLRNSNYATVESIGISKNFTVTAPGTNGNQTAAPLFVDFAGGDFRQLPSSPTIDAGLADPLLGPLDLAGVARVQARCIGGTAIPDIGAYEFTPTEACPVSGGEGSKPTQPASPPAPLPPSNKIGFGKLSRDLRKGTATLSVLVPGPGTVVLGGKGVVGRQLTARKAETLKLLVKAKGRKARRLADLGKVKLRPTVTFAPLGGSAATAVRPLALKLQPPSS